MSEPAPVVVGVDGSVSGRDALDWAVAEAATRLRPLWIVHACPPPIDPGPLGPVPSLSPYTGTSDVLQEAARRARLVAPEVEVTARLVSGGPVPALLGQRASLIVVGSRGRSGVRRALAGSVSVAVSARAQCPVVVVPPLREVVPGPSRAQVVVGVDGSYLSSRAIDFALRAAAQRGVGLTALHAWIPRPPVDSGGLADDWAASRAAECRALDGALAGRRGQFPTVAIKSKLACDDPAHALAVESAGAALVVVGSRGRGCMAGVLFGSVSQVLLHEAHCPIAVVRPRAATAGPARAA
ncbi:universal stress protein [Actinomycetospora rhizophila]|uniref:Universal stress protein n=2 Tax=Actinomycetospora TaxID=402649 RepID=A0ABV9ZAH3_9PSEU|nr:universal stress protein [Actinomycetospora chibensis]MDD7923234.1 universal stress protein [Actinomycetospora chibensis]